MRNFVMCLFALMLATQIGFADTPSVQKDTQNSQSAAATKMVSSQDQAYSDLKITQAIRKAIMADRTLSNYAKNIQIVTEKGNVTLKGFVASKDEGAKIEALAKKVDGVSAVKNMLQVNK